MAGDYQVMRTKVTHAGVICVDTIEELVDVTELFMRCSSLPKGGAAVLTESGAFKALTLDFCESLGLALPALGSKAEQGLRAVLPEFIPPTNPLDLTAQGLVDPDLYHKTLPHLLLDESYGSIVLAIILTDPATSGLKFPPIIRAIKELQPQKPVIFAGLDDGANISQDYVDDLRALGVPFFASPERAFRALAHLTEFAARNAKTSESASPLTQEIALASGVIPEYASKEVLSRLNIPIPKGEIARNLEEAQKIAERIGFPIVLKAQSVDLSHKSDAGGVVLRLTDPVSLSEGWERLHDNIAKARPGLVLEGVLVEAMGKWGTELIVGGRNDPEWGPILLVGFGGVLAEALHDIRLLPADLPVSRIEEELQLLKSAALLRGFRGSPPLDVTAAAEIVAKLGALLRAKPEIVEVDINPVLVYPKGEGAIALDALIVTESARGP
jgi:acyl-CoA synthetase (NDP forming)